MLIKHLKAAAVCAAKNDMRHTINGVYVEYLSKEIRTVATDCAVMAVLRESNAAEYTDWSFITPIDVIAAIKGEIVEFEPIAGSENIRAIVFGGNAIEFRPIDGRYPDYRRVIPETTSGDAADFNPELIGRFAKVAKELKVKSACVVFQQNGRHEAAGVTITGYDDFIGVIMPLRLKEGQRSGWATWAKER